MSRKKGGNEVTSPRGIKQRAMSGLAVKCPQSESGGPLLYPYPPPPKSQKKKIPKKTFPVTPFLDQLAQSLSPKSIAGSHTMKLKLINA